jgi:O-acetyl-ADP-ribose deacetylase (regulator of RNase III)
MLLFRRTNIMESNAQTVVNTVNCVGVMGKGLAKSFRDRYPAMFNAYVSICEKGLLEPGKLWLWQGPDQWVLNFPTKKHWRQPSRIEWIEAGLEKFVREYEARGITEISFPRLGCGNGNLDWNDVRPLMLQYLSKLPIPVYVHDFAKDIGMPEHLEDVSAALKREDVSWRSFDGFIKAIRRAAKLSGGQSHELGGDRPVKFSWTQDELHVTLGSDETVFEEEDLRGVWASLAQGLVTAEKAGWSTMSGGDAMLSVLALLPDTRVIQVQADDSEPVLAIEPAPHLRGSVLATPSAELPLLAWH